VLRCGVPVDSTHPEYDENVTAWLRARDVFAGEDAVKAAGVRYLPRLDSQTDDEYAAYRKGSERGLSRRSPYFCDLLSYVRRRQ
jgi:hypothetical protein